MIYADIAVSLAVKSVVDMLKMWVHKRTRAENNLSNHYQSKVWYLAIVTNNFRCNISTSCLKAFIHLNHQWLHSLQSSITINKLAKSGIWHCHLQWQCTQSCVTYMLQEWYQWKRMSCSLQTGHIQILRWIDLRIVGLSIWITFFDTHCIMVSMIMLVISSSQECRFIISHWNTPI